MPEPGRAVERRLVSLQGSGTDGRPAKKDIRSVEEQGWSGGNSYAGQG